MCKPNVGRSQGCVFVETTLYYIKYRRIDKENYPKEIMSNE